MKKIILALALIGCAVSQVEAGILFSGKCPKNITCLENEILGDDGKCYSCDYEGGIGIFCNDWKKVQQICPDRLFSVPFTDTYLKCPEYREPYTTDDGVHCCVSKCDEGYKRISPSECYDEKTGTTIVDNY